VRGESLAWSMGLCNGKMKHAMSKIPHRVIVINTRCLQHMGLNINNAYYLFPTRDRWLEAVPHALCPVVSIYLFIDPIRSDESSTLVGSTWTEFRGCPANL
jgi:hypothetical protein